MQSEHGKKLVLAHRLRGHVMVITDAPSEVAYEADPKPQVKRQPPRSQRRENMNMLTSFGIDTKRVSSRWRDVVRGPSREEVVIHLAKISAFARRRK